MKLDVLVAPAFLKEDDLTGCQCAVIDVLRATSTIITALVSGAAAVHPCLDIAEARRDVSGLGRERYLLGGEDMGQHIPGFDMGNSPLEYMVEDVVAGKDIYFYTSNGTGAIRRAHAGSGKPVYIAALLNLSAVSSAIVKAASTGSLDGIVILCAGRYGNPSAEDFFCAGLLVRKLISGLRESGIETQPGDSAIIAAGFATAREGQRIDVLASSDHGRFLRSIGFESDLEFASELDFYDAVPIFDGERVALLDRAS
ncbi:MAG TPA: 2-phosphosulfolactate phosphatase [Dehalococcoidia bacterium]|nr:2-phosphosulfolactate phosphatase [Dehalococcoidia bacterium]